MKTRLLLSILFAFGIIHIMGCSNQEISTNHQYILQNKTITLPEVLSCIESKTEEDTLTINYNNSKVGAIKSYDISDADVLKSALEEDFLSSAQNIMNLINFNEIHNDDAYLIGGSKYADFEISIDNELTDIYKKYYFYLVGEDALFNVWLYTDYFDEEDLDSIVKQINIS